MSGLASDFKKFLLRGNVVDLAVAVVVGVAFAAVVTAFVQDMITPLIAAIFGKPDFSSVSFTINGSEFLVGDFINKLISFISVATVIFFLVITPMNAIIARSHREPPADPTTKKCSECLSVVPIDARRCAFCTSDLGARV